MPPVGSLANVAVSAQFVPVLGRAAGHSDCAQSKLLQSQTPVSEHAQELQESPAKSLAAHGASLAGPARPVAPAASDEPVTPDDAAVPAELMVPALPALPGSLLAPIVALLPAHASAMQLDATPNPSHPSFVARLIAMLTFCVDSPPGQAAATRLRD